MIVLTVAKLSHLRVPFVDAIRLVTILIDAGYVAQLYSEPIVCTIVEHARLVDCFARVCDQLHLVHVVGYAYYVGRKIA